MSQVNQEEEAQVEEVYRQLQEDLKKHANTMSKAEEEAYLIELFNRKMQLVREETAAAKAEADRARKQIEAERKKREKAEAKVAALNRRVLEGTGEQSSTTTTKSKSRRGRR